MIVIMTVFAVFRPSCLGLALQHLTSDPYLVAPDHRLLAHIFIVLHHLYI